jgi:hypothetical protein
MHTKFLTVKLKGKRDLFGDLIIDEDNIKMYLKGKICDVLARIHLG